MNEPFRHLSAGKRAKLIGRAMKLTEAAMTPHFSHPLGVQYLMMAFWTRGLVERRVVTVGAESTFARAWDVMARVMEVAWDELEKSEGIAVEGARALGSTLAAQGYFVR